MNSLAEPGQPCPCHVEFDIYDREDASPPDRLNVAKCERVKQNPVLPYSYQPGSEQGREGLTTGRATSPTPTVTRPSLTV